MRMQAKRASEFCLFLKHANIFQSSILQLSKHQSEASIWVMFISEAYKYFLILQLLYFFGAISKRVLFSPATYNYFSILNSNAFNWSTLIFFGCYLSKKKRGCERSEHPSSSFFRHIRIFFFNISIHQL